MADRSQTKTGARNVAAVLGAAALVAPLTLASEGLVTKTSPDPVGIATGCWGHAHATPGKTYTLGECEQIGATDLVQAGAGIAPCIKVPISNLTRASFTDFAFNAGTGAFCTSTMAKKLNAGDLAGACAQFSVWVKGGLPGIIARRQRERNVCECGIGIAASCEAAAKDPLTAPLVADRDEPPPAAAPVAQAPAPSTAAPPPAVAPPKPTIWTRLKEWFA